MSDLELLLELGRIREIELTADVQENPLGIVGVLRGELERCHPLSGHDPRGVVKSLDQARLTPLRQG